MATKTLAPIQLTCDECGRLFGVYDLEVYGGRRLCRQHHPGRPRRWRKRHREMLDCENCGEEYHAKDLRVIEIEGKKRLFCEDCEIKLAVDGAYHGLRQEALPRELVGDPRRDP